MLKVVGRIINIAAWLGIIALVILLLVVPLAMSLMFRFNYYPNATVQSWLLILGNAQTPAMYCFIVAWVAFVGSCFASFLNVVAWRVPRGKSVLGSSHCPQCKIKLKFPKTNLPVLGWLKNGGRCANCELPIPVRYLIAELVLGSAFLILFLVQTATGGATIPFRTMGPFGNLWLDPPPIDLFVTLGFHLLILSVIFTFAIAATEKFKAPISIVVLAVLAAIGVQASQYAPGILDYQLGTWTDAVGVNRFLSLQQSPTQFSISAAIGVAAAGLFFLVIKFTNKRQPYGVFASLLLVGIGFGWQAVTSVTIFFLLISIVTNVKNCGSVVLALLLHLCLWKLQGDCQWWPGPASGVQQIMCGIGYIGVLAVVSWAIMTPEHPVETVKEVTVDLPSKTADVE